MRKQDLVEGEEYAAGSRSRLDKWCRAHIRVVALDGTRTINGRTLHGIVVQLVDDCGAYGWRGKAGDEKVLTTATQIHQTWSSYAPLKIERDRKLDAALIETRRLKDVGDDVVISLRKIGYGEGIRYYNGSISIKADVAAKMVERLAYLESMV